MRARIAWFKYRPSHPAGASKHAPGLNLRADALSLSREKGQAGDRFAACLLVDAGVNGTVGHVTE